MDSEFESRKGTPGLEESGLTSTFTIEQKMKKMMKDLRPGDEYHHNLRIVDGDVVLDDPPITVYR